MTIRCSTEVSDVLVKDGQVEGVRTKSGEEIQGKYVMVAPGREGNAWLSRVAHDLDLPLAINPVDVGVRVEMPPRCSSR